MIRYTVGFMIIIDEIVNNMLTDLCVINFPYITV